MVLMAKDEFEFVYRRLNSDRDVKLLHERMNLPYDMLFNVLARKITRNTTRDFYKVKAKSGLFLKDWKKGESILKIAKRERFPPALMSVFIMEKISFTKKQIREMLKNPDGIKDSKLKRDVKAAVKEDFVYAPSSSEHQMENSKKSENCIMDWLDLKKVKYMTEDQNRELEHHRRTPDFLLKNPIDLNGKKVHWIESKASFGDVREISRDYKKQLSDYKKHFGFGAVVYFYGYVVDHGFEDILVLTKEDFTGKSRL